MDEVVILDDGQSEKVVQELASELDNLTASLNSFERGTEHVQQLEARFAVVLSENDESRPHASHTSKLKWRRFIYELEESEKEVLKMKTEMEGVVRELCDQSEAKKKTIAKMRGQMELLKRHLVQGQEEAKKTQEHLRARLVHLMEEHEHKNRYTHHLEEKVSFLYATLEEKESLEAKLKGAQGEVEYLKEVNIELQSSLFPQIDHLTRKLAHCHQKAEDIQEEQQSRIEELMKEGDSKEQTIIALKKDAAEMFSKLQESQQTFLKLQEDQQSRIAELMKEGDSKEQTIIALKKDAAEMFSKLQESQQIFLKLQKFEAETLTQRDVICANKEMISELHDQIDQISYQLLLTRAVVDRQNDYKKAQEAQIEDLLAQAANKNEVIADLEKRINDLSKELEHSSQVVLKHQGLVEDYERTIAVYHSQDQVEKQTIATLTEETDKLKERLSLREQERICTQKQHEARIAEFLNQDNVRCQTITALQNKVASLTQQLEKLRNSSQVKQAEMVKKFEDLSSKFKIMESERAKEFQEMNYHIVSLTSQLAVGRQMPKMLKSTRRYGLPNVGNTSYINSVLQCLFNIAHLKDYFVEDTYKKDLKEGNEDQGEVSECFAQVMKALASGVEIKQAVLNFKEAVGTYDEAFCGHQPKESCELLRFLLTSLHENLITVTPHHYPQLRPRPHNPKSIEQEDMGWRKHSIISQMFHGMWETQVTCGRKNFIISRTREPFKWLTVSVPPSGNTTSLQDLLRENFKSKNIRWDCPVCGHNHICRQVTRFSKLPQVLLIHLSRRYEDRGHRREMRHLVLPSERMALQDYAMPTCNSVSYRLNGMCRRHGSTTEGHYATYCHDLASDTWSLIDDDSVQKSQLQKILEETDAQILFYLAENYIDPSSSVS